MADKLRMINPRRTARLILTGGEKLEDAELAMLDCMVQQPDAAIANAVPVVWRRLGLDMVCYYLAESVEISTLACALQCRNPLCRAPI